jgi:hypothetical protein
MRAKKPTLTTFWIWFTVGVAVTFLYENKIRSPWFLGGVAAAVLGYGAVRGHLGWRGAKARARRIGLMLGAGDLQAAIPELREMVAECEWISGRKNPITTHWRHLLAQTLHRSEVGPITEALNIAMINLDYRTETLGPDHSLTLASRRLCDELLGDIQGR